MRPPLLLLAVLPGAWAAVRSVRMRYATLYGLIPARHRKRINAELPAERESAAEVGRRTLGRSVAKGRLT
ncbi:hypothetical protein [Nonomuraea sp. NPDC050786]|uniref:hypothetical protein n=1 Tax=Nonomuraea sp. NPDC050786 TaxID=3154840 RepID=UPI0033CAF438